MKKGDILKCTNSEGTPHVVEGHLYICTGYNGGDLAQVRTKGMIYDLFTYRFKVVVTDEERNNTPVH